jgi:SAM-dependent methyltransferase
MTRSLPRLLAVVGTLLLLVAMPSTGCAQAPDSASTAASSAQASADTSDKEVPYVPTSQPVVKEMLDVAGVTEDDVVYDLGSGDGRIPITAAEEFGARAVGIEIEPDLVQEARKKAEKAGVSDRVTFHQGDLFKADLSDATVVALYLFPEINLKLRPKLLRELDPGDRIVSHDFRMGDWEPDRTVQAGQGNTGWEVIHLWTVPEEVPEDLLDISDEADLN